MHQLWLKLTSWIDRYPSKVPLSKRVFAYVIDWAIGGIVTGFPAVLIYAAVTKKSDMFSDLYIFATLGYPKYWAYIAGLLCFVFSLVYYVYIPYKKYPGQTLGKHWMNIKIVNNEDYSDVTLRTLVLRQVVGLILLEGSALVMTNYLRQMLTLATGFYLEYYLGVFGGVITIISGIFVVGTPSHRAIHDYIAKTRVVLMDERKVMKKEKKKKHK